MSSGSQTNMLRWREKAISTQEAQIKVVAAILSRLVPVAASVSWEHVAREVLEALAAEAGEREPDEMCLRVGHRWIIECQRCGDNRTVQSEITATIERCARVADNFRAYDDNLQKSAGCLPTGKQIAATIRALKDQAPHNFEDNPLDWRRP